MKRLQSFQVTVLLAGLITVVAVATSGCGSVAMRNGVSDVATTTASMVGKAMGGEIPITGATVQMWAVGTTGYGSAARPLVNCSGPVDSQGIATPPCAGVPTGPGGSFDTGANTCPTVTLPDSSTADSYVYLTSTGGNTGSGTNSSASLIIAAGDCQKLESNLPSVVINEVSTVASVTALQQFMGVTMGTNGAWNIGTPLSNYTGMKNAFATVPLLTNMSTSGAPSVSKVVSPVNGTSFTVNVANEQSKIYTMADILAYCVNSIDGTGSTPSSQCSALFSSLNYTAGTPADTIQAAYAMAQNPYNVGTSSTLPYSAVSASAAFMPALSSVPNDWTVGLSYYSGSNSVLSSVNYSYMSNVYSMASDSQGNIWFVSGVSTAVNSIGELSPGGIASAQVLRGSLNTPRGLALDTSDNIWVAQDLATVTGVIVEYASGTVNTYNVPTGDGGLYNLEVDGNNNVFALSGQKLLKLLAGSASGATAVEYETSAIGAAAQCLAIGANEAIYISAETSNGVTTVIPGTPPSSSIVKTPTMVSPFGVAIDANGVVWTADRALFSGTLTGNYITQVTTSGNSAAVGNTGAGSNGIGDGGVSDPQFIAVDGANHLWVSNFGANAAGPTSGTSLIGTVSEFDATTRTPITNTTGYVHTFTGPRDITVDQSGNVWVGNENSNANANSPATSVALTEIVGAGAPTYGSKALAVANNKIGQKP